VTEPHQLLKWPSEEVSEDKREMIETYSTQNLFLMVTQNRILTENSIIIIVIIFQHNLPKSEGKDKNRKDGEKKQKNAVLEFVSKKKLDHRRFSVSFPILS
jgi:hypothetical protein